MSFVTIGGVTLHYKAEGPERGAPLVFINSLGTDLRIWDGVVCHLVEHFHIVRYDKRGHGLSDSPPGPYTLADERADLAGLLAYLNLERPIVAGISVGGMIALNYAAHHAVRGLVVADSTLRFGTAEYWQARSAAIGTQGMEAMASSLASRWFAPDFAKRQPAIYRGYVNMLARMPEDGYRSTCDLLAQADVSDYVEAIKAPALVLGGTQDLSSPPEVVRELAAALPGASFALIEDAGHLPCIEQPAAMAGELMAFFTAQDLLQ